MYIYIFILANQKGEIELLLCKENLFCAKGPIIHLLRAFCGGTHRYGMPAPVSK